MKLGGILIVIYILTIQDWVIAQEFTSQNSGTGQFIRSISMVGETTGYLSANAGVIRKTTNSGQTWEAINSPTSGTIWGIYFINEATGWIVGDGGFIGRTTDGGTTWVTQTKAASNGSFKRLWGIHFIDSNNGFIVGSDGIIFKSTNGGITWAESRFYNDGGYLFRDVYMYSTSRVIAVAPNSRIMLTTNGGSSWSEVNYSSGGGEINAVSIAGSIGYGVGGDGLILKTTDSGSSWSNVSSPTSEELRSAYFIDSNTGYVSGDGGFLFKTTNGGSSWSSIPSGTTNVLYTMGGFSESVWVGGAGGLLLSNVVLPPSIEVNYPNGGEVLTERDSVTIEWTTTNLAGDLLIELYKNEVLETNIAQVMGSEGEYNWYVPESLSEDSTYSVIIRSAEDSEVKDESDSVFTIQPQRNEVFATSDPVEGGTVYGAGTYVYGESVQLIAEPADSYLFLNWTSNGTELGVQDTLAFVIERDTTITANFEFDDSPPEITISFPDPLVDTVGALGEIPVYLDFSKSTEFESFEFQLEYDPTVLTVFGISLEGSVIADFDTISNGTQSGLINFTGASSEAVDGDGLFLTLNTSFDRVSTTNLTWNTFYFNEGEPLANPINGVVEIVERARRCGDVTDDGSVTNEDATWILRNGVKLSPQYPLLEEDSLAADVTANGRITAYDASQVLKEVVGLDRNFNCEEPLTTKINPLVAVWDLQTIETESGVSFPVNLNILAGELESIDMEITVPEGFTFSGFNKNTTDWIHAINQKTGKLFISMVGLAGEGVENLGTLQFDGQGKAGSFKVRTTFNEQVTTEYFIEDQLDKPLRLELFQNYPNPFNPATNIRYSLPEEGRVQLRIYNALGQQVAVLDDEVKQAGTHSVRWDATSYASGIYVYKVTFGNTVLSKKLMLVK